MKNKYITNISHSAQCHNIKHVSCIFTCIIKTESLILLKTVVLIQVLITYSISICRTPYEVVNFINIHKYGLVHFNRMSNYIIHSLYVVMGSFA